MWHPQLGYAHMYAPYLWNLRCLGCSDWLVLQYPTEPKVCHTILLCAVFLFGTMLVSLPPPLSLSRLFAKGLKYTSRRKDAVCRPQKSNNWTVQSSTRTAVHEIAVTWKIDNGQGNTTGRCDGDQARNVPSLNITRPCTGTRKNHGRRICRSTNGRAPSSIGYL